MDDLENLTQTMSKENNALEQSESDRTASILIKASKSKDMSKSVSFSFLSEKNDLIKNDNEEPIKSYSESVSSQKTYSNIDDNINKSNQSNCLSVNITPQQNSYISSRSTEFEDITESGKETISNYFGWDGYEARFERPSDHDSRESVPQCIPSWAKPMRKKYGMPSSGPFANEYQSKDNINVQTKIKHLMDKYNDLMLVKRVESKKQVIVEQGKYHNDIDTIKTRAKHTRYYVTPLTKGDINKRKEVDGHKLHNNNIEETSSFHSDNLSLTEKTSKTQAKREVYGIIQPVKKHILEQDYGNIESKDHRKCKKLSLKNIREYVNAQSMTPDQRKLHEIIKIEKVPRINGEVKDSAESKYIINVPQNKPKDGTTVNVIKIKEKRKLRVQSLEDVREKTTEFRYGEGTPTKQEKITLNGLSHQENKVQTVGKTVKSPTETKTFQVTSQITPCITPFVEEEQHDTDKVLLIQYEKKSSKNKSKDIKQAKYTTKLLGVRRPALGEREEMYMYEAETCGEKQKEYTTKVECVQPTLKEKLNAIFDELRGLSPKTETLNETSYSDIEVKRDQSDVSCQRPSEIIGTDVVSVQATPDMKSVEVQVRQSQILCPSSALVIAPHPSPISDYRPDKLASIDKRLEKAAQDLVTYAETKSDSTNEQIIKKESLDYAVEKTKQFDEDEQICEFDGDKSLDRDTSYDIKQSEQSLNKQAKEMYKGTELEEVNDEFTNIEQVEEGKDKTDTLPASLKSVTFGEAEHMDGLSISPEVINDVADKSELMQDTTKDEEYVTAQVLSDLERPDKPEDEIFVQKNILDPFNNQQQKYEEVITRLSKASVTSSKEDTKEEYHTRRETSKEHITGSHKDSGNLDVVADTTTSLFKIDDDIRSYNLDGYKDTKLNFTSSSKFLLKRNSIRKRLNWSDDTLFLEKHLCPQLIRGLAETAVRRPTDPISFLAHWIYKDYQNREEAEQEAVHQEHRQLERTMCDVQRPDALVHKKFNLKTYPVKKVLSIISEKAPESLSDSIIQNEIEQEA